MEEIHDWGSGWMSGALIMGSKLKRSAGATKLGRSAGASRFGSMRPPKAVGLVSYWLVPVPFTGVHASVVSEGTSGDDTYPCSCAPALACGETGGVTKSLWLRLSCGSVDGRANGSTASVFSFVNCAIISSMETSLLKSRSMSNGSVLEVWRGEVDILTGKMLRIDCSPNAKFCW